MRNDIYALRRSGNAAKIAAGDRLAKPATVEVPFSFRPGQWYRLANDCFVVGEAAALFTSSLREAVCPTPCQVPKVAKKWQSVPPLPRHLL